MSTLTVKSDTRMGLKTMMRVSLFMLFLGALFESNKANATVFSGSVVAAIAVHAEGINEILQMFVSLITIAVGITTIIVARYNFIKMKKKDDQE